MTRRTLVLVRHAQAGSAWRDHERPLTDSGREQAHRLGVRLARILPAVDHCASSDAARAVQTTAEIRRSVTAAQAWEDAGLYGAGPAQFLEIARAFDGDVGMIVGHEPTVSETAGILAAPEECEKIGWGVPTATALVLEFTGEWAGLSAGSCAVRVVHEDLLV